MLLLRGRECGDEPLTLGFPGGSGRWGIRRSTFREQGLPHDLLVLTDLSRTLREEELQAFHARVIEAVGKAGARLRT